jgi:hypothetical protein
VSFTSAHQAGILVGASSITAKLTSATMGNEVAMLDSTTLADTAQRYIAGQGTGSVSFDGWADAEVQTLHSNALFFNALGVQNAITVAPQGFTAGNFAWVASANDASFEVGTETNGVCNFSLSFQPDGGVAAGVSLHALTAETVDANGTAVDTGLTSTTLGAVANVHATAYSGLTNVIFTIEDSANGSSGWATVGTFTTLTAAGSQSLRISGTVRRYLRVVTNVTGTGSVTFACAAALL